MKKNEEIAEVCAYCEHAVITPAEGAPAGKTPLDTLLSLPALLAEGQATLSCPHNKTADPGSHCFRFRFDPCKYIPEEKPEIVSLDPNLILK